MSVTGGKATNEESDARISYKVKYQLIIRKRARRVREMQLGSGQEVVVDSLSTSSKRAYSSR